MKCFNHIHLDAVGICKSCFKGICPECVIEVEGNVSCKGRCEEKIKIDQELFEKSRLLIQRNPQTYQRTAEAYYKNALIYFLFGFVFLGLGIFTFNLESKILSYFGISVAVIMIFGSILQFFHGRKFKNIQK